MPRRERVGMERIGNQHLAPCRVESAEHDEMSGRQTSHIVRSKVGRSLPGGLVEIGRGKSGQDRDPVAKMLADEGGGEIAEAHLPAQLEKLDVRVARETQLRIGLDR